MKDRLMLIVAAVAGLTATVLAFLYIDSAAAELEEVPVATTMEVLFAVQDLAANSIIDANTDLRVETIVVDDTPGLARGAVKASERAAVDGRPIGSPLPAGVPLLYAHLTPIKDVELTPGTRAMAITVSRENLMGGILVPGDHVDILVSYEKPPEKEEPQSSGDLSDPNAMVGDMMSSMMSGLGNLGGGSSVPSDYITTPVLLNVRVIAVGTNLTGSRQAQMFGLAGGAGGASTITLELTPDEALVLLQAQANGRNPLTLLLRPDSAAGESATSSLTGG